MGRHGLGAVAGSGVVVLVAAGFVALALLTAASGHQDADGFRLHAVFPSSDGLDAGDAVVIAGIPVGRVLAIRLDRVNYVAVVDLELSSRVRVPSDSRFAIQGGSAGDGVLSIEPGRSAASLAAGAMVTATIPAESLEQQVGDYIFGNGGLGEN